MLFIVVVLCLICIINTFAIRRMALTAVRKKSYILPSYGFDYEHTFAQYQCAINNMNDFRIENTCSRRKKVFIARMNPQISSAIEFATQLRNNPWYVWTTLSISSSIGILTENTKIGSLLSSPLITMGLCLIFCNIGILPTSNPVYSTISKTLVPLAVPLLLLDADMRKCFAVAGSLLKAFLVGSVGTIVGTFIAYWLVPMKSVVGAPKIAAALCARHIGGAVNFVAVADILNIPAELMAAAIAADNLIIAFYFSFLFLISAPSTADDSEDSFADASRTNNSKGKEINLASLSSALTTSLLICAVSMGLSHLLSISHMLLLSGLTVALATAFPGTFGPMARAGGTLGVLFMQLFFAATGAIGHIPTVLRVAPAVLLHTSVQIVLHFLVTMSLGRVLRIPFRQLVLASNANVGGPTTASAMAVNKKWRQLVLPALLTGIFGFAIATQIGVLIYKLLLRL